MVGHHYYVTVDGMQVNFKKKLPQRASNRESPLYSEIARSYYTLHLVIFSKFPQTHLHSLSYHGRRSTVLSIGGVII